MKFDYPLNGNEIEPNVDGIQGVLDIYYKTLEDVKLGIVFFFFFFFKKYLK